MFLLLLCQKVCPCNLKLTFLPTRLAFIKFIFGLDIFIFVSLSLSICLPIHLYLLRFLHCFCHICWLIIALMAFLLAIMRLNGCPTINYYSKLQLKALLMHIKRDRGRERERTLRDVIKKLRAKKQILFNYQQHKVRKYFKITSTQSPVKYKTWMTDLLESIFYMKTVSCC